MGNWMPRLTSNQTPLTPYRVIWDLLNTVDVANTIVTHDSGSPRDQLVPFWRCKTPRSYIGWGKSTQLGYGLGLTIGAKLAAPDKLCINVWGDAAIGFTGMDLETAARDRIPILSILFNNFVMAAELNVMKFSTDKFQSTAISGNYADFAKALGCHGERVTEPGAIVPAIKRALAKIDEGQPALLEFITERQSPRSSEVPPGEGIDTKLVIARRASPDEAIQSVPTTGLLRFARNDDVLRAPMPGWSIPARSAARPG